MPFNSPRGFTFFGATNLATPAALSNPVRYADSRITTYYELVRQPQVAGGAAMPAARRPTRGSRWMRFLAMTTSPQALDLSNGISYIVECY